MANNNNNNNNNEQQYQNHQIIRIDGKSRFVESLDRSFNIGKVTFNFVEYDDTKEAGNRIVAQIPVYMDFSEFRVFAQDMLSGRFAKFAEMKKNPIVQYLKGTSAERLKAQNREREDGKSESRKFYLSPSAKGFFFTAELGPGEATETGLIKPAGKPEKKISIPMDGQQAKELVLATLAAVNNYEIAKETTKQFEALLKAKGVIK